MKTLCVLVLAASGLIVGTANGDEPKGYRVNLQAVRVGTTDFNAGDYKIFVNRDQEKIQFMALKTGQRTDVAAKVEDNPSKFERTEVILQEVNGVRQIHEIRIGGTKLRISIPEGASL